MPDVPLTILPPVAPLHTLCPPLSYYFHAPTSTLFILLPPLLFSSYYLPPSSPTIPFPITPHLLPLHYYTPSSHPIPLFSSYQHTSFPSPSFYPLPSPIFIPSIAILLSSLIIPTFFPLTAPFATFPHDTLPLATTSYLFLLSSTPYPPPHSPPPPPLPISPTSPILPTPSTFLYYPFLPSCTSCSLLSLAFPTFPFPFLPPPVTLLHSLPYSTISYLPRLPAPPTPLTLSTCLYPLLSPFLPLTNFYLSSLPSSAFPYLFLSSPTTLYTYLPSSTQLPLLRPLILFPLPTPPASHTSYSFFLIPLPKLLPLFLSFSPLLTPLLYTLFPFYNIPLLSLLSLVLFPAHSRATSGNYPFQLYAIVLANHCAEYWYKVPHFKSTKEKLILLNSSTA